jgi:DCN1-like protein 1/2
VGPYVIEPEDPPDMMSIAGMMAYFEKLNLSLEDPTVLALSEALKSPTMGEFTRQGFVEGWGTSGLQ